MAFDILKFLETIFAGFNVADIEAKVLAWLQDEGAKYPDLTDRINALAAWITQVLLEAAPSLVLSTMKNTIVGIAMDIVHGTAGVDPSAWTGMG